MGQADNKSAECPADNPSQLLALPNIQQLAWERIFTELPSQMVRIRGMLLGKTHSQISKRPAEDPLYLLALLATRHHRGKQAMLQTPKDVWGVAFPFLVVVVLVVGTRVYLADRVQPQPEEEDTSYMQLLQPALAEPQWVALAVFLQLLWVDSAQAVPVLLARALSFQDLHNQSRNLEEEAQVGLRLLELHLEQWLVP